LPEPEIGFVPEKTLDEMTLSARSSNCVLASHTFPYVWIPERFELLFTNGDALILIDDDEQHESFVITLEIGPL
jgi:hypothetical protein